MLLEMGSSVRNITLGQNLKRIRKELGLNQQEIVGQEITRNLISMIENDKSPMSYRIAQIAAENMNKVLELKEYEIYVDPDDIMNPERVEAKGRANKYIRELKNYLDKKKYKLSPTYIGKIINFLNQWRIPEKKVEIYELLGELSYLNGDLNSEYLYFNKALENYFLAPIKKDIHVVGRKLIANCINTGKYNEGLTLIQLDIMNRNDIPKNSKAITYYNEALIYKRLKDYDKSLELLDEYEDYIEENNEEMFKNALIVKGTCYHGKKEYQEALEVYKKITQKFEEDIELLGLAYCNIINNYRILDSKEKIQKYKDILLDILPNLENKESKYLIDVNTKLGKMYEYLSKIELAEYHYISAINKAVERKEKDKCAKLLFRLLSLYNKTNQQEKILLSNNIFKKGFQNSFVSNEMKLAFSLILTNMKLGKEEIASDILTNILKKEEIKDEG